MNPEPREALVATARAMNDSGLNRGTSGNLSLRGRSRPVVFEFEPVSAAPDSRAGNPFVR